MRVYMYIVMSYYSKKGGNWGGVCVGLGMCGGVVGIYNLGPIDSTQGNGNS